MVWPVVIASAVGGLAAALPSLIFRGLSAVGIGLIVYNGAGALLSQVSDFVNSSMGALSGYAWMSELAGFFMIDKHISILLSAVSIKLTLIGLDKVSGTFERFGRKK